MSEKRIIKYTTNEGGDIYTIELDKAGYEAFFKTKLAAIQIWEEPEFVFDFILAKRRMNPLRRVDWSLDDEL